MKNLTILALQMVMAVSAYLLIFRIYLQPWFKAQPFEQAVLPLLVLHIFRYLGLSLIVPGQIADSVPREALQMMAWSDFASGVCALLAALAVFSRSKLGTPLVALFTVVGLADLMAVGPIALNAGVFQANIGTMWFVLVIFAPTLLLTQIYIAYRLFSHLFGKTNSATTY